MTKSWRLYGWEKIVNSQYPDASVDMEEQAALYSFEDGAGAMLKALRNNQWCPFDSSIWQATLRGKVVVIPDDKEEDD